MINATSDFPLNSEEQYKHATHLFPLLTDRSMPFTEFVPAGCTAQGR